MRELPEPVGQPDTRSATRYLWWLFRCQARGVLAATAFGMAWMVSMALTPAAVGRAIDAGVQARDPGALAGWTAVVVCLGAIQAGAAMQRHRTVARNYLAGAFATVTLTVRKATQLGAALPRRLASGEVVSIGVSDAAHIADAMVITGRGVGAAVGLVVAAVLLISTTAQAGWVAVAVVPVGALGITLLLRPLHRRQQRYRAVQAELATQASDIVTGLRVLRGIGGEDVFYDRYQVRSRGVMRAGIGVAAVDAVLAGFKVLLPGLLVALVVLVGARQAIGGAVSPGQLVAAYGYAAFLTSPLSTLTSMAGKWAKAHVAAGRVIRLLNLQPDVDHPTGSAAARLDATPQRLTDAESGLTLRPGRFTAVAATDPADALAIADRLGRFRESPGVCYGDQELSALTLATVRDTVLVTTHEDRLFSGRLRDQLAPHLPAETPDSDRDKVITDAIDVASAGDVIDELPAGLDTHLTAAGRELSGGQQQRLLLARALITEAPVLVLVDPTSAVDAHTEARIATRLGPARAGRTTAVMTTSPLVLARADHVVFVSGGRVAGEGTHAELLSTSVEYAETVTRGEG